MLGNLKKKLSESEFSRHVLLLFSGTAIAQAVPILISPVLTRIYTPDQFATLGVFTALISILGVISTGKYEFAIMLPEKDDHAKAIAFAACLITLGFGVAIAILIFLFHDSIIVFFNNPDLSLWLYLVPVGIIFTGITQILNFQNNRRKSYRVIANSRIIRSVGTSIINVSFGFLKGSVKFLQSAGLMAGLLAGQLIEIVVLKNNRTANLVKIRSSLKTISLKELLKRYANFPKFDVPSEIMVTASIQLPVLLLNRFFERSVVGLYFHAHRILSIPMSMLGSAIGQVLLRQLSECRHDKDKFRELVSKAYRNLILIASVPYVMVAFFGRELFSIVFGAAWAEAGVFAQLIAPWLLFNFIGAPLTMIFTVREKQRRMFFWITGMFVARVLSIYAGIHFFNDAYHTILLFSISGTLFYFLMNFYLICFLSDVKVKDFIKYTFGLPLIFVAVFGLIKFLLGMLLG
jgi:O-antigen/teichoic acid export membrane protein